MCHQQPASRGKNYSPHGIMLAKDIWMGRWTTKNKKRAKKHRGSFDASEVGGFSEVDVPSRSNQYLIRHISWSICFYYLSNIFAITDNFGIAQESSNWEIFIQVVCFHSSQIIRPINILIEIKVFLCKKIKIHSWCFWFIFFSFST